MNSIYMQLEGVEVSVTYTIDSCPNSNGVGGPTTYEVDIQDVEVGGVDIMHLLREDLLMRIDEHLIDLESE